MSNNHREQEQGTGANPRVWNKTRTLIPPDIQAERYPGAQQADPLPFLSLAFLVSPEYIFLQSRHPDRIQTMHEEVANQRRTCVLPIMNIITVLKHTCGERIFCLSHVFCFALSTKNHIYTVFRTWGESLLNSVYSMIPVVSNEP